MQVFQEWTTIGGIGDLIILSAEYIRNLHAQLDRYTNNMLRRNITCINKLPLCLKYLQQRGDYESGTNFNNSSIHENEFHNFKCYPLNNLSSAIDSRTIFTFSTPKKLIDSFESVQEEATVIKFETSSTSFNGDYSSSLTFIRESTSFPLTSDSINVAIAPKKIQARDRNRSVLRPKSRKDLAFVNLQGSNLYEWH